MYDSENDHEMMEALRPSIEEAQPIHSQQLALDYIGKRASQVCGRDCRASAVGCALALLFRQALSELWLCLVLLVIVLAQHRGGTAHKLAPAGLTTSANAPAR